MESVARISLRKTGPVPGLAGLTRWSERNSRAETVTKGVQTVTYYSSLLDHLSDDACVAVIAHELAHAWLNEHVAPEQSPEREREADELAADWGFSRQLARLDEEAETIGESAY